MSYDSREIWGAVERFTEERRIFSEYGIRTLWESLHNLCSENDHIGDKRLWIFSEDVRTIPVIVMGSQMSDVVRARQDPWVREDVRDRKAPGDREDIPGLRDRRARREQAGPRGRRARKDRRVCRVFRDRQGLRDRRVLWVRLVRRARRGLQVQPG